MPGNPYDGFQQNQLILRDHLAASRTALANERTLLAYIRTALTMLIGGASFMHFSDYALAKATGFILIPTAVVTLVTGIAKYRQVRRRVQSIGGKLGYDIPPATEAPPE